MKKILVFLISMVFMTGVVNGQVSTPKIQVYDSALATTTKTKTIKVPFASTTNGVTDILPWIDSVTSSEVTINRNISVTGYSIVPLYNSAALFEIPNYTRVPPNAKGAGMLMYNGTVLSKYYDGTYWQYKTMANSVWGTCLKEYWYSSATPGFAALTDWSIDVADTCLPIAEANSIMPITGAYATDTDSGKSITALKVTSTPNAALSDGQYRNQFCSTTLILTNPIRFIVRVKFPTLYLCYGVLGGTIRFKVGTDKDYVNFEQGWGPSSASGMYVSTVSNSGTEGWSDAITSPYENLNDGAYHDIEIYVGTTATFTVKIDGVQVASNATSGLSIRNLSLWECTAGTSAPRAYIEYRSGKKQASSSDVYIAQADVFQP